MPVLDLRTLTVAGVVVAVLRRRQHADDPDEAAERDVLTPYSVSPRLRDQTVRPKPTKYCVTFTPNVLAGHHVADLVQRDREQDARTKSTSPRV